MGAPTRWHRGCDYMINFHTGNEHCIFKIVKCERNLALQDGFWPFLMAQMASLMSPIAHFFLFYILNNLVIRLELMQAITVAY